MSGNIPGLRRVEHSCLDGVLPSFSPKHVSLHVASSEFEDVCATSGESAEQTLVSMS